MKIAREPYIEKAFCKKCHTVVEIHVPAELQASLVIAIWDQDFGHLCKKCLAKNRRVPCSA